MSIKKEIKKIFNDFVDALEKNDFSVIKNEMLNNVSFTSTNYGNAIGNKEVVSKLTWQGPSYNYSRYKVMNFVCFADENHAKTSAVVTSLVGKDEVNYFHYFQFAGYWVIDYVKINDLWYISRLAFNLDMEDGNTIFVDGWWNLIDYGLLEGNKDYPIVSELDNPWMAFKHPEAFESEEDAVKDALFRYAWGIDHADFKIFTSCVADRVSFVNRKNEDSISGLSSLGNSMSKDDLIRFMKYKRYKEPTMEHIYKIVSVEVNDSKSVLKAYRYEPHRLGTTKLNKLNKDMDFYSGSFFYEFRKEKDGWKMTVNGINSLKCFCDGNSGKRRFFSEDD